MNTNKYTIQTMQQVDGSWIAAIDDTPGRFAYGKTEAQAILQALAQVIFQALNIAAEDRKTQ